MKMTMNLNQSNLLKKAIQILLPISVLSFVVSQSSILHGLLNVVYSNGAGSASSSSIKLFEYKTERNCAFLLFNGLLALIIKNSGLKMAKPVDAVSRRPEEVIAVREDEDEEDDEGEQNDVDVAPDVSEVISGDADEDGDEEVDEGVISVDELNRKCDDFIKKMRERIETDSDLHELQ